MRLSSGRADKDGECRHDSAAPRSAGTAGPVVLPAKCSPEATTTTASLIPLPVKSFVPDCFRCPLTQQVMRDPVATCDGQVYERGAIEKWFWQGRRSSPLSGLELEKLTLLPQPALQAAIEAFVSHPCAPQELGGSWPEAQSSDRSSPEASSFEKPEGQLRASAGGLHRDPASHERDDASEVQRLLSGLQRELLRAEEDVLVSSSASQMLAESIEMARRVLRSAGTGETGTPAGPVPLQAAPSMDGEARAGGQATPGQLQVRPPIPEVPRGKVSRANSPVHEVGPARQLARSPRENGSACAQSRSPGSRTPSPAGADDRRDRAISPREAEGRRVSGARQAAPPWGARPGHEPSGPAPRSSGAAVPGTGLGKGEAGQNLGKQTPRRPSSTLAPTLSSRARSNSPRAATGAGSPGAEPVRRPGGASGASAAAAPAAGALAPRPALASAGLRQRLAGQRGGGCGPGQQRQGSPQQVASPRPVAGSQPSSGSRRPRSPLVAGSASRAQLEATPALPQQSQRPREAAGPNDSHGSARQQRPPWHNPAVARSDAASDGPALVGAADSLDSSGRTPLIHAAAEGKVEALGYQLAHGAAVNATDSCACTALMYAATYGHLEAVRVLIEHGAEVEATSQDGWTPLIATSYNGHLSVVQLLLEHRANVEAADERGWTSLMHVAFNGDNATLRCLLDHGALSGTLDTDGRDALVYAAFNGHVDNTKCLLGLADEVGSGGFRANAASAAPQKPGGAGSAVPGSAQDTALLFAAIRGHLEVLRLLLGAHPPTVETRHAARKLAADHGHAAVVELLNEGDSNSCPPQSASAEGAV